jgi:hypothetical protein
METERSAGWAARREFLDHVIVFNEQHLRRLLRDYLACTTPSGTTLLFGPLWKVGRLRFEASPDAKLVGLPAWTDFTIVTSGERPRGQP